MKKSGANQDESASELISKRIAELGDWRGKTLGRMRSAHQGSRRGCRRGVEVGESHHARHAGVVARRHHLHWRVLQECREADLREGRVSEGSGRVSSTRASTETCAARSTSTKAKRSTRPPSRRSFARRRHSTVPARRNRRRNRGPEDGTSRRSPGVDSRHQYVLVSDVDTMRRQTIPDLLPGTLDLLILRTLQADAMHGWAISERIQQISARRAPDQPGLALPGAASARASGLDRGRMARLRAWTAREVLPAHRVGPAPARRRSRRVGPDVRRPSIA